MNADESLCSDVACETLYKGWNSNVCEKYAVRSNGRCGAGASCDTTPSSVCSTLQAQAVAVRTCDVNCVNTTACPAHTPVSSNNNECIVSAPSSNCPALNCSSLLFGWDAGQCRRYADGVSAGGYCSSGAVCETNAAVRCGTLTDPPHVTDIMVHILNVY